MKKCIYLNILFLLLVGLYSCGQKSSLNKTFSVAGANREELQKVIQYYKNQERSDTLKLKAALFLIENMAEHYTVESNAIDSFVSRLHQSDSLANIETLDAWWMELSKSHKPIMVYDACVIKADFLIENINKAFDVWRSSQWKNDIDFNEFCQYILPYRFQCEQLIDGWRDSLYNEYYPLIAGVKDMNMAFAIIHNAVLDQMGRGKMKFPYIINVLDMRRQAKATCMQRCVYLGSVLRSVGLPVSIDIVNQWANYSKNGHAWIALVANDGTYTIAAHDSIPKLNNEIDSSLFPLEYQLEKGYQLATDFKKRTAKVVRLTYKYNDVFQDSNTDKETLYLLSNPFATDVSKEYNLNTTIKIEVKEPTNYVYLCTFATGKDWRPVTYSPRISGKYVFPNMGDSIVYLPIVYSEGKMKPVDYPFISLANERIKLKPCFLKKQQVILTRKYPFIGSYINSWGGIIGARFEGSNQANFKQKDIIFTVNKMPAFRNEIVLEKKRAYRYIRYVSPEKGNSPISEFEFWSNNNMLKGQPSCVNANKVERCFDNDTFTMLGGQENGYIVGIDFGESHIIDRIIYYPKNDGNFIIPNNEYELFYYDMKWVSLGRQRTYNFDITYNNVPTNALYLLKNNTKGSEERIFTYKNGAQIWW